MSEKVLTLLYELETITRRAREIVDELTELTKEEEDGDEEAVAIDYSGDGAVYLERVRG